MSHCALSLVGETLVNVLDCKKDMGLWHGVLTVRSSVKWHLLRNQPTSFFKKFDKLSWMLLFCSQSIMNRIHTITVPYAVMKACPMSWVQRVHIHKGFTSLHCHFYQFLCYNFVVLVVFWFETLLILPWYSVNCDWTANFRILCQRMIVKFKTFVSFHSTRGLG